MLNSNNLTKPDPAFAELVRSTYSGQAHFAKTGPKGATCGACAHWEGQITKGKYISQRRCAKRTRMMGGHEGTPVPGTASACHYFEKNS